MILKNLPRILAISALMGMSVLAHADQALQELEGYVIDNAQAIVDAGENRQALQRELRQLREEKQQLKATMDKLVTQLDQLTKALEQSTALTKAYADSKASQAERAAKAYANTKASQAEQAAKAHANTKAKHLQRKIAELERKIVVKRTNLNDLASRARWESSQLIDAHNGRNNKKLPWMGKENDNRGFVRLTRSTMENGTNVLALRMHPQWKDRGAIKGWFPWVELPSQWKTIMFKAQIGFVNGARRTDGVTFWVWEHHMESGREVWNPVITISKGYTGYLQPVLADLSHLAGKKVKIELRVDAGESSGQDWAAWVNPQIIFARAGL